jgi:hypothetical protein
VAPGAMLVTVVWVWPLTTMVAVKLVVALPRLLKVTVAVTVVPGTPLVGKAMVVLTSLINGVRVRVVVLLVVVVSGTLVVPTPAVTVAPLVVTVTVTGMLMVAPGAMLVTVVWVWPLTTMVAVKLVVADPKLPKVIVAVTVVPTTPLAGKATVVLTSLNSGVKVADVAEALEPTEVVNEPAGMSLISGLDELLVTTAETEQLAPGGTTDPTDIVIAPNPEVAAGVALAQVVVTNDGLAFTKPAGY